MPLLLHILKLSRSTFYYWAKVKEYSMIRQRILALYQENQERDGYRMIRLKLRREGILISGKTVLAHMQALGIRSRVKMKRSKKAGKPNHVALNLLYRYKAERKTGDGCDGVSDRQ